MAPICVNRGNVFQVNMSLRTTLLLVSIVLISTILTVIAYSTQRTANNNLCSQYGIAEAKDHTGTVILSVLSTVMGILSIAAIYRTITTDPGKIWNWLLPISYISLTILFIILTILTTPKEPNTNNVADSVVANWCQQNKNLLKNIGITSGIILGLVVGGTLSFMSLILSKRCIM